MNEGPFKYLKTWDHGDFLLRSSLTAIGDIMFYGKTIDPSIALAELECRIHTYFKQRKSAEYRWSKSDGLTRWIYDHIFRYFHFDPYKGLNFDQLRAYWLYLYLRKNRARAIKQLIGFILRLGFAPSFMEHIIMKPQSLVMLLATVWKPLRFLVYPFFYISAKLNLREPIEESTTNKITLLPTLAALGWKVPQHEYLIETYKEYFKPGSNLYAMGQNLADGIQVFSLTRDRK